MGKSRDFLSIILNSNSDNPFDPTEIQKWKKYAKTVDAMPDGAVSFFDKKKKNGNDFDDIAARIRAANKVPEAVVKVASYGGGVASAKGQIDYISRDGNLELELSDGSIINNKEEAHELIDEWANEFSYRKGGSRNTMHMVVSAPKGSNPDDVLKAGREFAAATFGDNHPYALVRHDDGTHPHVHILMRMRGDDGKTFRIERDGFQVMRETFAEKCRDNGIEMNATPRAMRGTARSESMALRKMREDGRVPETKQLPMTEEVFIEKHQKKLNSEAKKHRQIADVLSMLGNDNSSEDQSLNKQADRLRELANFLEEGGQVTRPEQVRELREDQTETSYDYRFSESQEAIRKSKQGVELAVLHIDKMPFGEDRDKALLSLSEMSMASDSLSNGSKYRDSKYRDSIRRTVREEMGNESIEDKRERQGRGENDIYLRVELAKVDLARYHPEDGSYSDVSKACRRLELLAERDMRFRKERLDQEIDALKAGTRRQGVTYSHSDAGINTSNKAADINQVETINTDDRISESEAPALSSNKDKMKKIRERDAAHAKERERNPNADRDR